MQDLNKWQFILFIANLTLYTVLYCISIFLKNCNLIIRRKRERNFSRVISEAMYARTSVFSVTNAHIFLLSENLSIMHLEVS